jgi:hypothetical protein
MEILIIYSFCWIIFYQNINFLNNDLILKVVHICDMLKW